MSQRSFGSEQRGALLVELLAAITILLMVLGSTAVALSRINRLQNDSETVFARSNELRVALNMLGQDVHHGAGVATIIPPGSSELDPDVCDPSNAAIRLPRTLIINRDAGALGVQYVIEADTRTGAAPGTAKLSRRLSGAANADLIVGLEPNCSGFVQANGGVTMKLTFKLAAGQPILSLRSFFFPRGDL